MHGQQNIKKKCSLVRLSNADAMCFCEVENGSSNIYQKSRKWDGPDR